MPEIGTWIVDEASFYDERLVYVVRNECQRRGLIFIFPALILNFRRDIFNPTARLMLETATDVFPLTAYCEHPDCLEDSFYTYRYYQIDGEECPALYFDPLIVIGGIEKRGCRGTELLYPLRSPPLPPRQGVHLFTLKPLGQQASGGNSDPLKRELAALQERKGNSLLARHLRDKFGHDEEQRVNLNALKVARIAERALIYLYAEQNLIPEELLLKLVNELGLDRVYMKKTLSENGRLVNLDQQILDGF